MTSKGLVLIGPSVPEGNFPDQSNRGFCKSAGRARTLIGGAQFASYYKCTEAAQGSLLEVVET